MIKPLTSLRFFFAFMVFLSHLWLLQDESPFLRNLYDDIFYEGYIGVSFFFILSGFILGYNYHTKILHGQIKFSQFWLARLARIYPLHILTLFIAIPLSLKGDAVEWITRFVLNIFLVQSFVPSEDVYFYFNAVSWSISDEWFFYLMFPFLVFLMLKKRNLKYAFVLLLIVPIGLLLVKETYHEKYFYINPLLRIGDFVLGKLLFRLYNYRKTNSYMHNKNFASLAEVSSIIVLCIFVYFHNDIPQGFRFSCYYWPPMIMLIYSFSYANGIISDFISRKTFVYLGEISFGFYMFHMLVLRYYEYIPKKLGIAEQVPSGVIEATIVFGITLALSMASYKWFEVPANRFIKRKLGTKI